MPVPLWLIGLALTAASAGARKKQQDKVEHRQDEFETAERTRESGRQKQRDAALDSTLNQFQPATQTDKLADATQKREQSFAATSDQGRAVVPGEYVGATTAPTEVKSEIAARVADYLRKGKAETQARAKLGAFGDQQFDNNVQVGRTGQQLDQLGDATRGSQGALDREMTGALHAGDDWGLFSDVLGAAGTATSMYGFTQPAAAGAVDPDTADKLWMHNNASGFGGFKFR